MRLQIITIAILIIIRADISQAQDSDSLMFRLLTIERKVMDAQHDTLRAADLLTEKAIVLKNAKRYDQSLYTLNRIPVDQLPDSMRCTVHFQKALVQYLDGAYSSSLYDMLLAQNCSDSLTEGKVLYLMLLLENEMWDEFRIAIAKNSSDTLQDLTTTVDSFRTPTFLDPLYYQRLAKVPGRGLIKSGNVGRGIVNISLQVIFIGFAAYEIYSGFYSTALFSGIQPARRFYHGGKVLTESLVKIENDRRIQKLKQSGYAYLAEHYGPKK